MIESKMAPIRDTDGLDAMRGHVTTAVAAAVTADPNCWCEARCVDSAK